MSSHYNIVIIGSGPGGYVAALKAGMMGATVAVVEKSHLGGTCLNNGCIPSKALLASAELIHRIRHADELGVRVEGKVHHDWNAMQKRKDGIVKTLRRGVGNLFKGRKVALHEGRAVLDAPGKVVVTKDGGASEQLSADKIILATGSEPAMIPGFPGDRELVCTSDESLHWKQLPKRLLIIGGGVIGCEFACMLEPLGVDVTIVEMLPSLLPELDEDLGEQLKNIFDNRRIRSFVGTKVEQLDADGEQLTAILTDGKKIKADRVLVAVGRRPSTDGLGLETVGLSTDRGFVRVNDRMETPVKGYYCIGDANGRTLLAHAGSAQGMVAVENALGFARVFDAPVPNCVFTFPEIASVGMTHKQIREKQIPVSVGVFPLGYLGKTMAVGETDGFVKVLRHRETDELLGVHMLGHNVTELIAAATALLHQKSTAEELTEIIFAHPTVSEGLKESGEDALGMAIHLPPRKILRATVG